MNDGLRDDKGELLELKHPAVPGYKKAFYIAFAIGMIYLGALFLISAMQ